MASPRASNIASASGLYFLNSFTWGKAMGDSEQALEYFSGYVEANPQNIRDLAAERGPSSFDVKLNNVTSVVYELPFGKGKPLGSSVNPFLDDVIGGWELNGINTAHTGQPLNVYYGPSAAQRCHRAFERLSRRSIPASQCFRQRGQPEHVAMINTYFAGYTFTTPPPAILSAIWAATRSALPTSSNGTWR